MVEDGRLRAGQTTGGLLESVAAVAVLVVGVGKSGQVLEGRCRILGSETCRSSQVSVDLVTIVGSGLTLQGLEDGGQLFCWRRRSEVVVGLGPKQANDWEKEEWAASGSNRASKVHVGVRTDESAWLVRKGDYSPIRVKVREYTRD